MLQFGERVPVVTGRNRGGFGGAGGDSAIYTQASVGTMITAVARIDGGDVIADIKFERSSVAGRPAEAADANAAPQGTNTVSVQTTVRAKTGEPLLVGGRQTGGKEAGQTWLVLTASVAAARPEAVPEPKPAAAKGPVDELKIVQLKHAAAAALANVLHDTFAREPIRIAVDERTNSLLLRGSPERLEAVLALVARLDEP
jgi:type II secretory pathway component GspD/PulD (secretin)